MLARSDPDNIQAVVNNDINGYNILILWFIYDNLSGALSGLIRIQGAVMSSKVTMVAQLFPLQQVRLYDSPFKQAMQLNLNYLHSIEPDRLLHTFRLNAGLSSTAEPYGGWETPDSEVRGHSLGHYLSACAMAWATADDGELKKRGEYIVAELDKCQAAIGTGYVSAWPESFIDKAETCERVWAPYYTLHKICAGLLDMYLLCENEQALKVLKKKTAWMKSRFDKLDDDRVQKMLDTTEQGGMNEVLANLYAVTKDPDHLALSKKFTQNSYVEPLKKQEDRLKGQHSNSFIPNVIGFARQYELTGDTALRDIAEFFWDRVVNHRIYATGGTSNYECWLTDPDCLADQMSPNSHETCCTYNLLKLVKHIFSWTADPRCADYYERALYNGILPTINPDDGMTMYYVPMQSGLYKTFGTPFNSFWCCTGTGMESHLKYGECIYFHTDDSLFVNLFIPSELTWPEKKMTLRQETGFPEESRVSLSLLCEKPVKCTLNIRMPYWLANEAEIRVNGEAQVFMCTPCSYAEITRSWNDGDKIDLVLPMNFHLQPMPDNQNIAAIMYGPVVLAGKLGDKGLAEEATHGAYGPSGYPVPVPDIVTESGRPEEWIKPETPFSLQFRTEGVGKPADVQLAPFYSVFERYSVYWNISGEEEWQKRKAELDALAAVELPAASVIDRVIIGDADSERAHQLMGEDTETGMYLNWNWRQAVRGGWFSYTMNVLPDQPMVLNITYWGADAGGRMFDILVDEKKIASQILDHLSPGKFVDVEYTIPEQCSQGKKKITIKFQAHQPRRTAGGLFGCAVVRKNG